mmetsp:Transcript_104381/g.181382  ORF Transcript_104381/g.181382 Transcript_104381/m.181382 type:complete len:104 (-) Transcript_104381:1319-1630(-)
MLSTGHWMRLVGIIMKIVHAIEEMTLQKLMPFWMNSLKCADIALHVSQQIAKDLESRTANVTANVTGELWIRHQRRVEGIVGKRHHKESTCLLALRLVERKDC